jgi:hypothetical protein
MTDEERQAEGAGEAIEDLEAPADAQGDVAGGKIVCVAPTCGDTSVSTFCQGVTCSKTKAYCDLQTAANVLHAQ